MMKTTVGIYDISKSDKAANSLNFNYEVSKIIKVYKLGTTKQFYIDSFDSKSFIVNIILLVLDLILIKQKLWIRFKNINVKY